MGVEDQLSHLRELGFGVEERWSIYTITCSRCGRSWRIGKPWENQPQYLAILHVLAHRAMHEPDDGLS